MIDVERELNDLLERAKTINEPKLRLPGDPPVTEHNRPSEEWLNDVDIFCKRYLTKHELYDRLKTLLFHRDTQLKTYNEVLSCMRSISKDKTFIGAIRVDKEQQLEMKKNLKEFDLFISHANKDKEDFVSELYSALKKLGINIFYDTDSIEWGDNWKRRIIDGTDAAEFAIIVISENFFDREWTEIELKEFMGRQNKEGEKIILPILHNITIEQLKEKYRLLSDIQVISSDNYTCDQIAVLFAGQLIKRLKTL